MNDSPELARLAAQHFKKRFKEEFGDDAFICDIQIIGNKVSVKLSIPKEWEPMTKDILENINREIYEIMNQGMT